MLVGEEKTWQGEALRGDNHLRAYARGACPSREGQLSPHAPACGRLCKTPSLHQRSLRRQKSGIEAASRLSGPEWEGPRPESGCWNHHLGGLDTAVSQDFLLCPQTESMWVSRKCGQHGRGRGMNIDQRLGTATGRSKSGRRHHHRRGRWEKKPETARPTVACPCETSGTGWCKSRRG